jgi:hypothetical protein
MNSTSPTLSPLRQRFLDDMRMRKLAPKTQRGYLRTVSRFYGWLGRSPDTATAEDLRRYQMYLVDHGTSAISVNATITGLKFFFASTLDQPELMRHMHPVREPRKIPIVLSPEEVARRGLGPEMPSAAKLSANTEDLFARSETAAQRGAQIVVWSEAATLVNPDAEAAIRVRGSDFARRHGIDFVMAYGVQLQNPPPLIDDKTNGSGRTVQSLRYTGNTTLCPPSQY